MIPKDPCTLDQKAKLDGGEAGGGQAKVSKWPCGLPALPRCLVGSDFCTGPPSPPRASWESVGSFRQRMDIGRLERRGQIFFLLFYYLKFENCHTECIFFFSWSIVALQCCAIFCCRKVVQMSLFAKKK